MGQKNVLIVGAAGRDFHNYLTFFKNNDAYNVVGFTTTQIAGIGARTFPKSIAGGKNIPIVDMIHLDHEIKEKEVDVVVLAYSDLPFDTVMKQASHILALGPDFWLMGPKSTMISSVKPVISITAIRTGCGKSQTTRYVAKIIKSLGLKPVVIRHPMPYGDLAKQEVQRFESYEDCERHKCTIEEREEYESHIAAGTVLYAGVDYRKILKEAEKEADVILWDGGNNDFPFYKSDLQIVVTDPHRPGHESTYYPGLTNLQMADLILINKVNTADPVNVEKVRKEARAQNPKATIMESNSTLSLHPETQIENKRVVVVEDGPTLTHGGMTYGAGYLLALERKANIVDPRSFAKGTIAKLFKKYKVEKVIPAIGYTGKQIEDLERSINASACDYVVSASPVDLSKLITTNMPILRVRYETEPKSDEIETMVKEAVKQQQPHAKKNIEK